MEERDSRAEGGNGPRSAMGVGAAAVPPRTPVPLPPRGELYRSFGDSYTRAFELAVTPTLFGLMGYGLDRWLGIVPVLTTLFALVALLTLMARTWSEYCGRMRALEQAGPWASRPKLQEGER